MTRYSRRAVCAAAAAALAGCADRLPQSAGFDHVAVEDSELVIEPTESTDADGVVVIDPDGEVALDTGFSPGQRRATMSLSPGYQHGRYEVRAVEGDETTASTTVPIEPELRIREVAVGVNVLERLPEDLVYAEDQLLVVVENVGSGPAFVTGLSVTGDVPRGLSFDELRNSGIFDTERGLGQRKSPILLSPSEKTELQTATHPFVGVDGDCEGREFELWLSTKAPGDITKTYAISSSTAGDDSCEIDDGGNQ